LKEFKYNLNLFKKLNSSQISLPPNAVSWAWPISLLPIQPTFSIHGPHTPPYAPIRVTQQLSRPAGAPLYCHVHCTRPAPPFPQCVPCRTPVPLYSLSLSSLLWHKSRRTCALQIPRRFSLTPTILFPRSSLSPSPTRPASLCPPPPSKIHPPCRI
jgi:hypothetical protein